MKGTKMKNSKKIITATLLLAAGYAGLVSAHSVSGTLGKAVNGFAATDTYQVTCYDANDGSGVPNNLYLHVKDLAPVLAPLVSTQASKGTATTVLSTDAKDGDAVYSPAITLTPPVGSGSGAYTVRVNKSASTVKGIEAYTLEAHCQKGTTHAGTSVALIINQ